MRPERILRLLAGLLLLGALGYLLLAWFAPGVARERPFVANSVVKVTALALCCLYASGWPARLKALAGAAFLAHVVSVAVMALYVLVLPASGRLGVGGDGPPVPSVLLGAMALDGAILALLGWAWWRAGAEAAAPPVPPERALTVLLTVLGLLFALATAAYAALPFLDAARGTALELPFVSNSAVKTSVLALLCGVGLARPRARAAALDVLFAAHVTAVVAGLALVPGAPTAPWVQVGPVALSVRGALLAGAALDLTIGLVLLGVAVASARRRERLCFLRPVEFRALAALAEVLVDVRTPGLPSAEDVARHVDRHLAPIRARKLVLFRGALFGVELLPLLRLRAPLSAMEPAARAADLRRRFGYDALEGLPDDRVRQLLQALVRIAKQLVYVGYYNDPRVHPSIGYVPFSQRPARPWESPPGRTVSATRIHAPPAADGPDAYETDVCVIGSGAAGSTLAHEFVQRGRDVLLVERGLNAVPATFTEDELEMVGRLYADGVVQQTADFRFTVLQASCLGGGTTVNNGVVFDPPAAVIERWNREFDAGIDPAELARSVTAMRGLLGVQRQAPYSPLDPGGAESADFLNPSSFSFLTALRTHAAAAFADSGVIEGNIDRCLGAGYENIGDRHGRKRGTVETLLKAVDGSPRLRIVTGLDVDRLRTERGRRRRVVEVEGEAADGRRIRVRARTFVIASGAVASSWLLLRNGIRLGGRVGRGFCANLGSYLTVDTGREVHSERGLQISHYAVPRAGADGRLPFVLETWFNPPAVQAINMPGWFDDHRANMAAYARMMAVGVLVGTEPTGVVRPALTGGAEVVFTPSDDEVARLARGLRTVGEIALKAGARRVMPNTWRYDPVTSLDGLERMEREVRRARYLTMGTGHPQGGNPISRDPGRGVVDADFRVHGTENLHVCDASVFPTSVAINPQMTVFALAHYAAPRIR